MEQVLIDKITVPKNAILKLINRLDYNTSLLEKQPGLIKNSHYEQIDEQGNLTIITIAVWKDVDALNSAKTTIQEDYRRNNINLPEKLKEWGVVIDRGLYQLKRDSSHISN
ncbi:hypothetical protein MTO98_23775 [Mucilaginibacter sp. SMC90]|uniref:hypothetical protein n=1 Tax=Mucilaginibacter sp. SMC90 TaxID=2929803 RepID=UPI001FB46AB8|nr:hypothetical protein [Mucilaginibacter sp. SMC90]UOE47430.1 hypothetical protein MTO98_23775 [Mucilaginibacter sp. SMC90]